MLHKKRKPSTFTNSISGDMKVKAAKINLLHSKSTYFYRWNYLITSVCGVALLCGIGLVLNPISNTDDEVYAETITANPTSYSSISMTISNSISGELSSGDTVTTNVEPGLVNYIDNNIKISTSRINRFYVTVQAAENSTSELTGTAHGEAIVPVGKDVMVDNFGDNTWGYALGDAVTSSSSFTYNSLPTYNTAITPQYTSTQNLQDGDYNLKLTFAAKINADKPSDHYTTKAMVSVVADAAKLTSMQDFAKAGSCSTLDGQIQLRDSRDDKIYWVGKINGQCMMTQNLDLNITADGLKAEDTDITADWNSSSTYKPVATLTGTSWTWNESDYNIIQSYDPGEYIINQATTSWTYCSTTKDPSACNRYTAITTSTADTDLHYAAGNYYSYNAATAGTGPATSTGQNAPGSICPKGWKLFDNSGTKSFGTILTGKNQTTIRQDLTYFPAAGSAISSGLASVGSYGYYWSSTRHSSYSHLSYYLYFSSSGYNTSVDNGRYLGYSVRCVLK